MNGHVGAAKLAVMHSMQPFWCDRIIDGIKRVEVRKTRPKLEPPFVDYIYCTQPKYPHADFFTVNAGTPDAFCFYGGGKVIGEFVCDDIFDIWPGYAGNQGDDCLTFEQRERYLGTGEDGKSNHGYGIHISQLKIYRKPLTLDNFRKPCIMPEMPYCPACKHGHVYISEDEAEAYRCDGSCNTEWQCLNFIKKAPQSWCYVERVK